MRGANNKISVLSSVYVDKNAAESEDSKFGNGIMKGEEALRSYMGVI